MNIMKFMLATFFVVCIAASATGCKHTEGFYGGYNTTNGGELLVPIIRWAF